MRNFLNYGDITLCYNNIIPRGNKKETNHEQIIAQCYGVQGKVYTAQVCCYDTCGQTET